MYLCRRRQEKDSQSSKGRVKAQRGGREGAALANRRLRTYGDLQDFKSIVVPCDWGLQDCVRDEDKADIY